MTATATNAAHQDAEAMIGMSGQLATGSPIAARTPVASNDNDEEPARHRPSGSPKPPLRYKVQFTADQAYVDLLERARALLWHRLPTGDLMQLQRLALEALIEKLMRQKCGARAAFPSVQAQKHSTRVTTKPQSGTTSVTTPPVLAATEPVSAAVEPAATVTDAASAATQATPTVREPASAEAAALAAPARNFSKTSQAHNQTTLQPRTQTSRHIPADVRHGVWQRDGGRCTFVDERGIRCRGTRAIEFHHERPYARGGPHTLENISLRCRSHNELAAEQDFGRELARTMRHTNGRNPER